jgi:hypothetical protein
VDEEMKMRATTLILGIIFLLALNGCGSGNGVSNFPFGYTQSSPGGIQTDITTVPVPIFDVNRPAVDAGQAPKVVIDSIVPYRGTVYPIVGNTVIVNSFQEPVTQFVTGRIINFDHKQVRVVVYALTNQYYIQPLNNSYLTIFEGYQWFCPSHDGRILVVLANLHYQIPNTFPIGSPPQVDGTNILAVAQQP